MFRKRSELRLLAILLSATGVAGCSGDAPARGLARASLADTISATRGDSTAIAERHRSAMLAMEAMAAKSDSDARAAASSSTPGRHPLPISRARDSDQRFLRLMLNHHEMLLTLLHERMLSPGGHGDHGSGADPAALDAYIDAEKAEMLAVLKRLYGESYSPEIPHTTPHAGVESPTARHARLMSVLQSGPALVDISMPGLRNPAVIELARKIRSTQQRHARAIRSVEEMTH